MIFDNLGYVAECVFIAIMIMCLLQESTVYGT
jgi:hypothetical protein